MRPVRILRRTMGLALVGVAAALVPLAGCSALAQPRTARPLVPARPCIQPVALDGDTLRCANLRASVRLSGIDAPELPGHCRRGRACAPGDPYASRRSLEVLLQRHPVTVQPLGLDRYGRTIGLVRAGRVNLSCAQLRGGQAIYKPAWDNRHLIAAECGKAVR